MTKKHYYILVFILHFWIFFSVLFTTPIQSGNAASQETSFSVKTSSNLVFERLLNETQVNNYTKDNQKLPSICALSNDTFAVAWMSEGQDGDEYGVYASVFNANTGNNITSEFQVNSYTPNTQEYPAICDLSNDTFVVAWQSFNQIGTLYEVYARVINATTGNNITSEILVNNYKLANQYNPSICALSSDTFAVAWQDSAQDGSSFGVYARVINATTGDYLTSDIPVNNHTDDSQYQSSICALSNDTFAVAWQSNNQDGSDYGVYARVFNATTGNNITREFQVNKYTENGQTWPSICALSSDMVAIAWMSYGQDGSGLGIYAKLFNATTGAAITNEFRVNHYTDFDQKYPSICTLSSDMFAIVWSSYGQDGDSFGIYARVFDATTGTAITNEFRVNSNTTNEQNYPTICDLSSDKFAIAWLSYGQDGDEYGVYVSVFGNPSTSLPSRAAAAAAAADDDDDDEEGLAIGIIVLIIVLASVGAGAIVIIVLIKKGILDLSKLKRK